MADAQNLFQDWYDTYVLPKKAPMAGVFSRNKPDLGLGLPASPTPAPAAPVAPPAAPENPLTDYTPQPEPATETPGPSWLDKLSSGMSESKGLSPGAMGILGMGLSMAATPPRAVPYSNAEIIGQSGLHGLAFYEKVLEDKRRQQALDVSAEEHKLTREDRRLSAIDRADYYKDRVRISAAEQQSRDEARKATAEERAVLDVPIDPAVAAHYGVDPKMTVRTFNKMQSGLVSMAKPEKEAKPDAFTEWYQARVAEGKKPTSKDIEAWHRNPTVGGGTDSGPGKVGAIGQVNRELVAAYLPSGRENLTAKGPAGMEELKGMMVMLGNTDQYGGTVNDARLRESLSVDQRKEYDFVKRKAQDYSRTMTPANAVARAQEDWRKTNPTAAAPPTPAAKPLSAGATRKAINGKSYVKMPDGKVYEE